MSEHLFQSFLGKYSIKSLLDDLTILKESEENFEELLKKFNDDEEIKNIIIQILTKQGLFNDKNN